MLLLMLLFWVMCLCKDNKYFSVIDGIILLSLSWAFEAKRYKEIIDNKILVISAVFRHDFARTGKGEEEKQEAIVKT